MNFQDYFWAPPNNRESPIFTVFSKEFCTRSPRAHPPPKKHQTAITPRTASILSGPCFMTKMFIEKTPSSANPQKRTKKNTVCSETLCFAAFRVFFFPAIFRFRTKMPGQDFNTEIFMSFVSGVAPANQTKERSVHELFAGAFRNKISMWIVLVFPRKNTRIHKNGRNSWTFHFGPLFGLVCRLSCTV